MHMLRHLRDPAELRRNPLVAPLFAGVASHRSPRRAFIETAQRVFVLVQKAVEALRLDTSGSDAERRERQYRILAACDLNGASRDEVMNELGISRRQFYRDRKDACEYIARCIAAEVRSISRPAAVAIDMFSTQLNRARALRHTGFREQSAHALRELIAETRSGRKKVTAWLSLVELLADDNRSEESVREFNEARAFAASFSLASANGSDLARMVAAHEPTLIWGVGDERRALEKDAHARGDLHHLARSSDLDLRTFVTGEHIARGYRAFLVGDFDTSNVEIARAAGLIERMEAVADSIRLRFLLLDAERKIFTPGAAAEARDTLAHAARLAQARGYVEMLAVALDQLALLSQNFNNLQDAMRHVREAVTLTGQCAAAARGTILLHAAEVTAESGDALRSIELAEQGRQCFPRSGTGAAVAWYHVARGRLQMKAYDAALEAAEQLRGNAAAGGNQRLLGSGLRLLAQAYEGLGQQEAARDHIDAAVSVLERFGQPYALSAAYRASARITGRAAHLQRAAEINAALTRTA